MSLLRINAIALLLIFLICNVLYSEKIDSIVIELWCELEPMVIEENTEYPLSSSEAAKHILEEAHFIISGMIYGLTFTYIPADKRRGVAEYFELTPVAEILLVDTNLKFIHTEIRETRFYARIQYELEEFQSLRIKSRQSINIPTATGRGQGNIFLGFTEKFTSIKMAIKDAVHNLLRPQIINKPREITGQILLLQEPRIVISDGLYSATINVKLNIFEIIPYKIF